MTLSTVPSSSPLCHFAWQGIVRGGGIVVIAHASSLSYQVQQSQVDKDYTEEGEHTGEGGYAECTHGDYSFAVAEKAL